MKLQLSHVDLFNSIRSQSSVTNMPLIDCMLAVAGVCPHRMRGLKGRMRVSD